jgi:hypothetical protein
MKRAKPKVRHVLLDDSFVNALLATDVPQHGDACALYGQLVDNYQSGRDRLFALSTVLGDVPREFRRNALAPVETMHVADQHRSAAATLVAGLSSPWIALSLVMIRRERITTVATATHAFDAFEIEVLSVAPPTAGTEAAVPTGYQAYTSAAFEPPPFAPPDPETSAPDAVSSETAPPPAPRSAAE